MKTFLFVLFLAFFGNASSAQNTSDLIETDTIKTIYKNLKVRKNYRASFSYQTTNNITKYYINEREVSEEVYKKYHYDIGDCTPCILESYNLKGDFSTELYSKAIQHTDAPIGYYIRYYPSGKIQRIEYYKEIHNIHRRSRSSISPHIAIRHGSWNYYNFEGELLYKEYWKNDYFIKQVPEQKKVEAWEVEIYLFGEKLKKYDFIDLYQDTNRAFTNSEIQAFEFVPKFKNKYTSNNLKLRCYIYSNHTKEYSLDEFKIFNLNVFLEYPLKHPHVDNYLKIDCFVEGEYIAHYMIRIR